MRRYVLFSATFFSLLALVQLTRLLLRWSVQVDSLTVPLWLSAIAFLIAGSLAAWGFRIARMTIPPGGGLPRSPAA